MKTIPKMWCPALVALFLGSSCATPDFESVSTIPRGRGVVYIYSLGDGVGGINRLTHNNQDLVSLRPNEYLVHLPEPGTNTYGFHVNWLSRGGLFGSMFLNHQDDPAPTVLLVVVGKTYYFKIVGEGPSASFWRMEETTALPELQHCHRVEIQKAK